MGNYHLVLVLILSGLIMGPRGPLMFTFRPKLLFLDSYWTLVDPDGCAKVENGFIIIFNSFIDILLKKNQDVVRYFH